MALMNKDFRLAMEQAAVLGVPMPATAAAYQMNVARAAKYPDQDYSSVISQMHKLSAPDEDLNPGQPARDSIR